MTESNPSPGEEPNKKSLKLLLRSKPVAEVETSAGRIYIYPIRVRDMTDFGKLEPADAVTQIRNFLTSIASLTVESAGDIGFGTLSGQQLLLSASGDIAGTVALANRLSATERDVTISAGGAIVVTDIAAVDNVFVSGASLDAGTLRAGVGDGRRAGCARRRKAAGAALQCGARPPDGARR